MGEAFLKHMWRSGTCDAFKLARLGVRISGGPPPQSFAVEVDPDTGLKLPGVDEDSIPLRIMDFGLCICETRFWNYAWAQWTCPGMACYINAFCTACSHLSFEHRVALLLSSTLSGTGMFAGLLDASPDVAAEAYERLKTIWHVVTLVESLGGSKPGLQKLRAKVYWISWPVLILDRKDDC